jgi:hypothetical protein
MATSKVSKHSTFPVPGVIVASLIVAALLHNRHTFLGVHLPGSIAFQLNNQLTGLFLVLAVVLFVERRRLNKERLISTLLGAAAIILFVVGLRYASLGVGPVQLMQDDGFTVTGGLLMLLSGLIAGWMIGKRK